MPKVKDQERIQRLEQQLRLFQKVSRFMVKDMSLQEVLQGIVSLIVEFMECDSCLVYLLDGNELVLCASNTPHPSTIGKIRLKLDEGLTGWVARERRLLAIPREAYRDPRFKYFGDLPEDTYEAFLSVPVIARNRVVGVINVQHRHGASAYRRRDGGADDGRRTDGLRAGAGAHDAGGDRRGQPRGTGAVVRTDFSQELNTMLMRSRRCGWLAGLLYRLAAAVQSAVGPPDRASSCKYFYDQDKTEMHLIDLKFPSAQAWHGGRHHHRRQAGANRRW